MKYVLPLLVLINCLLIQGVLEWTVVGKATRYGQNVTLFCNVSNCCPKDSGWDRWTPKQRTLFIDVKTGRPNKKYDGKALKDGYTLIIQNLTESDLNASYSCLYGVTLGARKFLLEDDVFTDITSTHPNIPSGNSTIVQGEIVALIAGSAVLVLVSVLIFIYLWKRKKKRKKRKGLTETIPDTDGEKNEHMVLIKKEVFAVLKQKVEYIEIEQDAVIPRHIREQINKQIEDWEKRDMMFVSTRASDHVIECLQDNSCVTVTAPAGVGKSFIIRHTALYLKKKGYKIIPVYSPNDVRDYYQPNEHTVFIIDDLCGNFTANLQEIQNWKNMLPIIKMINGDKCCKIIVSCRLQVYKDDKFKLLKPFQACECNLISDELCLSSTEKTEIAKSYIGSSIHNVDDLSQNSECFPLLCYLYHEKKIPNIQEFFRRPFDVYKNELDMLSTHGDEGNYKVCSLALVVIFNNHLTETWFQGNITDEQLYTIKDICNACKLNSNTSKATLQEALDTLDGTYICKHNGIYGTRHDKLFDFLAIYFGQKMISCLIDHGDSNLIHGRGVCQMIIESYVHDRDLFIEIPYEDLCSYLNRFIKDWKAGNVVVVLGCYNMKTSMFREQLVQFLQQMDKSTQETLANTNDTALPKDNVLAGTTALQFMCYIGYTDMVVWLLDNGVDVDKCGSGNSACLLIACRGGHSDIVRLLLKQNPDVDVHNKRGVTPLILSCMKDYTCIVKLLVEHKANVNAQTYDGGNALYFSANLGNIEIIKLLLNNNADCNVCGPSKDSIIETIKNEKTKTIDEYKQLCFDSLKEKVSSHVTDYVSTKSIDYVFEFEAGSSQLHISCFMGMTNIVYCLLEHNANINIQKEDGTTPLFYACEVGHEDIVGLLLCYGANKDIRRLDGTSPLDIATTNRHTSIVKMIKEAKTRSFENLSMVRCDIINHVADEKQT